MLKNNFEVEILVNGSAVKEYYHKGKNYIEGKKGSKYSIKVINKSCRRILAIPTVDGLSVIDGNVASYNSQGYIVDGYSSITINGWRKSSDKVAEFLFSGISDSYADKSDKGGNQGVIGVAIFYEKENKNDYLYIEPYIFSEYQKRTWGINDYAIDLNTTTYYVNSSCCLNNIDNRLYKLYSKQELGTGWGEEKESNVRKVEFSKESSLASEFSIYYKTREELKSMGVDMDKRPMYVGDPSPFPGEYCKPPIR